MNTLGEGGRSGGIEGVSEYSVAQRKFLKIYSSFSGMLDYIVCSFDVKPGQ